MSENKQFNYFAFISYKRDDEKWAKWLQKKLETYGFPVALRKDNPSLPSKIRPIFRDQSELSGGNLKNEIEKGLEGSKYLIVICSPRAAKSPWVSKEVQYFIDNGRENNIIPFIIGGNPNASNPEDECFPEGLRQLSGEKEILGININEMGRDAAAIKVIARMFNLRFDSLWQRHERAKRRRRLTVISAVALLALISFGIGTYMTYLNTQIRAERDRAEKQTVLAKRERNRANSERDRANTEKNRANTERDNALKANRDLAQAKDSIQLQSNLLAKTNKDLEESNHHLAEERDNVLKANIEIRRNQCLAVAEKAVQETSQGNVKDAMLALLNVSPCSNGYQYVPEVEAALRVALDSINGNHYNYQKVDGDSDFILTNNDGNRFVQILQDNMLEYYNLSLNCISRILLPNIEIKNAYLSTDGNYFLLNDSTNIYYYNLNNSSLVLSQNLSDLTDNQYKFFQTEFLDLDYTNNGYFLDRKLSAYPSEYGDIVFYNKKSKVAVLLKEFERIYDDEVRPIGEYTLLDLEKMIPISHKFQYLSFECDNGITSIDMSPDGNFLAFAFSNGSIEVFDIKRNKSKVWNNPEENTHGHYSNNIKFASNSRWLFQTHTFQNNINIIDAHNVCLIDSIKPVKSPEGSSLYLLTDNRILCNSYNTTYIYTKGRQCAEVLYDKDKFIIDEINNKIIIFEDKTPSSYDVRKLEYENTDVVIKNAQLSTREEIIIENDGFTLWNLAQNNFLWKYNHNLGASPFGFSKDYRYAFVKNNEYRGGDYISIIEMSKGLIIRKYLCDVNDIYINENDGLIFIPEFDNLKVVKFPSYDMLLTKCLEITKGLNLTRTNKKLFFIE